MLTNGCYHEKKKKPTSNKNVNKSQDSTTHQTHTFSGILAWALFNLWHCYSLMLSASNSYHANISSWFLRLKWVKKTSHQRHYRETHKLQRF